MFSSRRIYTSVRLYTFVIFLPELYTPLYDYISLWHFSLKYIQLCGIKPFCYFCLKNINLCAIVISIFSSMNIYLCASWQEWSFLHLKVLSTWRIYTSVQVFFNFFCWRIPLCELTLMVLPSLEYVFYLKNIHLSTSRVFYTWKKNYPKNMHLCASWQKWHFLQLKFFLPEEYTPLCKRISIFSMQNIYLCESWLIWCFLRLKMLSARRIYTSVLTF